MLAALAILSMSAPSATATLQAPATSAPPAAALEAGSSPLIAVGGIHVCALPGDGTVLCWGSLNYFGELGDGRIADPTDPAGDTLVQQIVIADTNSAGGRDCVDVSEDGFVVRCHGSASLTGVTAIAAGYSHTCALLEDTTVKCWGSNAAIQGDPFTTSYSGGELGDGTTTVRPAPVTVIAGPRESAALSGVRSLSAATGYTCAVLIDDTARCWGNAPQATSLAPIPVMADANQPLTEIASISAGDRMACAVLLDGGVVCWGSGFLGSRSSGGGSTSAQPVQVTVAGDGAVTLGGIAGATLGHNVFNGPNGVGLGHSCALESAGGVACWGFNDVSQLGSGVPAGDAFDYAVPVVSSPGSRELLSGVTSIAAGGYFTCASIDDGSVTCWGLGLGGDSFAGAGAPVPLALPGASASAVAAGGGTICTVLDEGSLWCSQGDYELALVPGISIAAPVPTPSPPPTATPAPTVTVTPPSPASTTSPAPTPIRTPIASAAPSPSPVPIATDVDGLGGEWSAGYDVPAVVTIAFADGAYSVVAESPVRVTGSDCDVPSGTLLATFAGSSGSYSGQHGVWLTSDCSFSRWAPVTLTLADSRLTAVLDNGERRLFTRAAVPFRESVPLPGQISLDPVILLQSLAIALGLVLLIPFPGALFDSTLEANYAEVMGRVRSARRRLAPIGSGLGRRQASAATSAGTEERDGDGWRTPARVALSLLLAALLGCLLDPTFGLDVASAATYIGVMGGVVVTLLVFALPRLRAYRSNRRLADPTDDPTRWEPYLRALPAALLVAIACVLISRLTSFQPGYLYGLIIGVTAGHELSDRQSARTAASATVVMLLVALAAWFALAWVDGVAPAAGIAELAVIVLQTALVTTMVAGLQGALFGLLPIRFFAGAKVLRWNPWVWGGLFGTALFGFWHVLVNPTSGYLADSSRTPLVTIVGLLLLFGLGSIAFWAYFRFRRRPAVASAAS